MTEVTLTMTRERFDQIEYELRKYADDGEIEIKILHNVPPAPPVNLPPPWYPDFVGDA